MSSPESVYYSPPSGYGVPDLVRDDQAEPCHLINLPNELLGHILSFLDPLDLAAVCQTCRTLNDHASADHIWQSIIQSHVPGNQVTSCYPCATFKELYVCHDPHWFLTKYKIWFCGRNLTGKLIVVRYDQRRGCIEGYQMLAVSNREHMLHTWPMDQEVVVHAFEPEVKLHLDKPALQLRAKTLENLVRRTISLSLSSSPGPSGSGSGSSSAERYHSGHSSNRYMAETPMLVTDNPDDTVFNNFLLARPLDDADAAKRSLIGFPYGNVWPPPDVPANHRVSSANFYTGEGMQLAPESRPATRAEVSDQAFHIRTWMEMRQTHPPGGINFIPIPTMTDLPHDAPNVHNQASAPWMRGFGPGPNTPGQPLHIGEEVNTYATLDPKLYTPTADKPWRGIWVGDYSGHGCEFLLVHQPDDDDDVEPFDESSMEQGSDETDEEFKRRKWEARVYRGKLEAIKLTGDPNVPRGECTFMAEDLGERGYVTTVKEEPFKGTRVVESMGHVAGTGFSNDKYIESQLLLISPDRLAQYWVGFGHISFFERLTEKLCAAETDALRGRGEAASDWVKIISTLHNSGSGAGPGAEAGITELATEAGSFADPG